MSSQSDATTNQTTSTPSAKRRAHTSSITINSESIKNWTKQGLPTAVVSLIGLLFMAYEKMVSIETNWQAERARVEYVQLQQEKQYLEIKSDMKTELASLRRLMEEQSKELVSLRVQMAFSGRPSNE